MTIPLGEAGEQELEEEELHLEVPPLSDAPVEEDAPRVVEPSRWERLVEWVQQHILCRY